MKKKNVQEYNMTGNVRITLTRRIRASVVAVEQPECVFVALGIQHAMRLRHIVICGLPLCTVFLHIIS